jgi:hypothetical protein
MWRMREETRRAIERERREYRQAMETRTESRELIGRLCAHWELADADERAVFELAIAGAERDMLAAADTAREALARAEQARTGGLS